MATHWREKPAKYDAAACKMLASVMTSPLACSSERGDVAKSVAHARGVEAARQQGERHSYSQRVDRPIPMTVSGSYTPAAATRPPLITLDLRLEDGGTFSVTLDGTLDECERLDRSVTYYGIGDIPQTDRLMLTRR
jgi:hypothetical protein